MDSSQPRYRPPERKLDSGLRALSGPPGEAVRLLAAASAAAAAGRRDVTRAALRLALGRGIPAPDLGEILLQVYLFAGYPRAINALAELAALVPEPPAPPALDLAADRGRDRDWLARGESLCRRVYGPTYDRLLATMARISPELGRWMVVEGYGKVLARPGPDARTRELCAVAALAALDVPGQLRAHLRGALLVGASAEDLDGTLAAAAVAAPEGAPLARRLWTEASARHRGG